VTRIITDPVQANNYLRSKNKADAQAEQTLKQTNHNKWQLEREIAMDPEEKKFREKDGILATAIGSELVKHYSGHGWEVECDIRNGIARIFNKYMSNKHGYLLHLKLLNVDTFSADIMRVGGELLETFGVSRGKFDEDEIMNLTRDNQGCVKADLK